MQTEGQRGARLVQEVSVTTEETYFCSQLPHQCLKHAGVRGGCRVGRVGHALGQVARAVQ